MSKKDRKERIEWIRAKLKEMAQPGYYGCWCAGYFKGALKAELEKLVKEDSN